MKDITIDENVLRFAEQILPLVNKMQTFVTMQQQLYTAFGNYKGEAKKEIDEYSTKQMKQLTLLCEGYMVLSANLMEIIKAFQITDETSRQRIEAFCSTLDISLKTESERMQTMLDSLGV